MNALQQFITRIQKDTFGFLTKADADELRKINRLQYVLVRCDMGRFTCPVQDLEHFKACVKAGGDRVRDVGLLPGAFEKAAYWKPEPADPEPPRPTLKPTLKPTDKPVPGRRDPSSVWFNEGDCGGVFDGFQVTSDADPGL